MRIQRRRSALCRVWTALRCSSATLRGFGCREAGHAHDGTPRPPRRDGPFLPVARDEHELVDTDRYQRGDPGPEVPPIHEWPGYNRVAPNAGDGTTVGAAGKRRAIPTGEPISTGDRPRTRLARAQTDTEARAGPGGSSSDASCASACEHVLVSESNGGDGRWCG